METNYFVEINGKAQGPFSIEQLKYLTITDETTVWKEGLSNWVKATEIDEIKSVLKISGAPNKISPPPLPIQTFDIQQKSHINRVQVTKTIFRLNRKWIVLISLLTISTYFFVAFLTDGFRAAQLYNKYVELVKSPQEIERNRVLSENRQFANEVEDRKNQIIDSKHKTPIAIFADSINKGLPPVPKISKDFAASQKTPFLSTVSSFDLSEYRLYLDNPDPDDPNLDNEMIFALKDKIVSSFGVVSPIAAICIFLLGMIVIIFTSKLWRG